MARRKTEEQTQIDCYLNPFSMLHRLERSRNSMSRCKTLCDSASLHKIQITAHNAIYRSVFNCIHECSIFLFRLVKCSNAHNAVQIIPSENVECVERFNDCNFVRIAMAQNKRITKWMNACMQKGILCCFPISVFTVPRFDSNCARTIFFVHDIYWWRTGCRHGSRWLYSPVAINAFNIRLYI